MTPTLGTEQTTVQEPLVGYATEIGWGYLSPDAALSLRKGAGGMLLYEVLREKLIALNPGIVTMDNVEAIIGRLESARTSIEGNAEILAWLRGKRTISDEIEKRQRNVVVVDYAHPRNNTFTVTDEWEYSNGQHTNRADVLFLVNGIPVALVETKSARKKNGIDEGMTQIRRYHRETPELLTAPQVFDITHLLDFYYGGTWSLERKNLSNWKDEEPGNFERKVKRFFARERFLRLLGEWIVFFKKDDELRKIILRQHQMRAVDKVVERTLDPVKRRGLVWHTQGSGKTLTMITAAAHILKEPAFGKPTVLMLVDRNELESQLFANLAACGLPAEVAATKQHLRELLRRDYRGLIVSMIHKFDRADADLCPRDNVIVLVDEAHRTTGGDLGNYLVGALPNATLIGFTGTPIDKTAYGQGTFKTFGVDDHPQGYLDKYGLAESIEDGTTVPLNYTLAPNEMLVPREQLEREFFSLKDAEGISDIEELNRILDGAVNLKAFLKADARVEKVARFVADHFRENVEPLGYKAFLVGVDREACALYKKELDKHLPPEYSTVVYTSAHNDNELLAEYRLGEDEEKQVRKAFIKPDKLPKILIVTAKLLTGHDAPILYCLYLDKPMRDHTLLQAIARVNRPHEDEQGIKKPSGFVVDFVGIFDKLERALEFDPDEVGSVIRNLDVLKERFAALMKDRAPAYLKLCAGTMDDKAVERAINTLQDAAAREEFFRFYRELATLHEIISPDKDLRPFVADYGQLSVLYQIILNVFSTRPPLLTDLMKKTEELVRRRIGATGLAGTLPRITIDERTLKALKDSTDAGTAKVVNIGRGLITAALEQGNRQPYLIPIGERAEDVLERHDDRQLTTQEAITEMHELVAEYVAVRKEREQAGSDGPTFTLYWVLKQAGVAAAEELAPVLQTAFAKYPHHRDNVQDLRHLKAELYKTLLPVVGKEKMVELAERLLRLQRGQ